MLSSFSAASDPISITAPTDQLGLSSIQCRRGYDVLCFAQAGATPAVGLDLSSEAVAVAASVRDKELQQHPEAAAHAEFVAGNFFEYVHTSGQQFDIGYDYTFLW